MKNDKMYVVFNNDSPEYYSFNESEAEEFASSKQKVIKDKNMDYENNGKGCYDRSYWHVHYVNSIPDSKHGDLWHGRKN